MTKDLAIKIGMAILVAMLIGGLITQRATIASLNSKVTQLTTDLETSNLNEVTLTKAIEEQNKTIEKFKYDVLEVEAEKNQLIEQLEERSQVRIKEVTRILKQPAPKTCEKSIEHLKNAAEDLKKW